MPAADWAGWVVAGCTLQAAQAAQAEAAQAEAKVAAEMVVVDSVVEVTAEADWVVVAAAAVEAAALGCTGHRSPMPNQRPALC